MTTRVQIEGRRDWENKNKRYVSTNVADDVAVITEEEFSNMLIKMNDSCCKEYETKINKTKLKY